MKLSHGSVLLAAAVASVTLMSPSGAFAGDGDPYAASVSAGADATTSGLTTIVAVPTGKAFRAAPQGGEQNIIVQYDCTAIAAGPVLRTHVPTCYVTTNTGASSGNRPSLITPGLVAVSAGPVTLAGSSAQVCMVGAARDVFGELIASEREVCQQLTLAL